MPRSGDAARTARDDALVTGRLVVTNRVASASPLDMVAVQDEHRTATHQPVEGGPDVPTAASIVESLARALELHDYRRGTFGETAAHTSRVTQLGRRLTELLAPELVSDPQLAAGFRLHDIGMIGIPIDILAKQGPLTSDELNEIREHPWLGERIVAPLECMNGVARQVIACHHERWDGSGYPRALRGTEIPIAARIFAVVDAFDAMTNVQPYREAMPIELALAEIEAKAGSHFEPAVVAGFLTLQGERHPDAG
jgi:response regulator RpfG family c-di-GMP phosphodiesterase